MSNNEDLAAILAEIESISEDELASPNMPVDVFLQESENLYHWCQADRDKLVTVGLDWTVVDNLPVRCGALRQSESLLFKSRFSREENEKLWLEKSPAAYELRNQLLHDFHFAYRKLPDLAKRVSEIADGNGHADMIQDLNDLAELGRANTEPLTAIGFDLSKLDEAAAASDEMADLLSQATADRSGNNEARILRDKAYTYLKQAVDEIRECGRYVFWRDEQRRKGYISRYRRRWNNKKDSGKDILPKEFV